MIDSTPEPILYTQTGCAESAKASSWLTDHGIAFREQDASSDPEAAQALAATGTFATPLLVIGNDRVLGYRPRALAALLSDWKAPAPVIDDGDAS